MRSTSRFSSDVEMWRAVHARQTSKSWLQHCIALLGYSNMLHIHSPMCSAQSSFHWFKVPKSTSCFTSVHTMHAFGVRCRRKRLKKIGTFRLSWPISLTMIGPGSNFGSTPSCPICRLAGVSKKLRMRPRLIRCAWRSTAASSSVGLGRR
jgi:hypothetical protein